MEANEVIQTLVRQMNQKNLEIERVSFLSCLHNYYVFIIYITGYLATCDNCQHANNTGKQRSRIQRSRTGHFKEAERKDESISIVSIDFKIQRL